jgi:5-methylcytosine-specific restriction endonuclease McrBC regulatory subunit McrC
MDASRPAKTIVSHMGKDTYAVRGRVELRHIVRQRPGRAFELTVRHAPLREDNPVGRVVRWLVGEVCTRTRSLRTRTRSPTT